MREELILERKTELLRDEFDACSRVRVTFQTDDSIGSSVYFTALVLLAVHNWAEREFTNEM